MRIKVLAGMAMAGLLCMGSNAEFSDFSDPVGYVDVWSADPDSGGAYQFGTALAVSDLAETTDNRTLELLPNTREYANALEGGSYYIDYWTNSDDGGLTPGPDGNKWMEAQTYFERYSLTGDETQATFSFTVDANDLDPRYEVRGFVKVLDPGAAWGPYGSASEVVITNGVFGGTFDLSIPVDTAMAGMVLQAGWVMEGLNANPADDWGSVTVTATTLAIPEPSSIAMIGLVSGGALFIRRRFVI